MKVVLYSLANQGRAGNIAYAMQEGLRRHGVACELETRWRGDVRGDVAIAYGWKHEPVFSAYAAAGAQYAYFDLGYFNRHPTKDKGGSREGHHRLAVNGWDTADTMARGCPDDRWCDLGIEIAPDTVMRADVERPGAILVVGMSEKAAGTHGFKPLEWETQALEAARRAANGREIIYRPKPKDMETVEPIESVLQRTAFILTHHSNVGVDGLVAAVPCHATKGVGKLVSRPEGWFVEGSAGCSIMYRRPKLAERRALLADVAYAQWTPDEMRSGAAWEHIRKLMR
jgi:hypothetical protein